jgi:hypothetical protein
MPDLLCDPTSFLQSRKQCYKSELVVYILYLMKQRTVLVVDNICSSLFSSLTFLLTYRTTSRLETVQSKLKAADRKVRR